MTAAELKSAYGEPIRTERHSDGSAKWYYYFGSQQRESAPFSSSEVTEIDRSYSFGQTSTTTTTTKEAPVHLSASERVVSPLPAGNVIVE